MQSNTQLFSDLFTAYKAHQALDKYPDCHPILTPTKIIFNSRELMREAIYYHFCTALSRESNLISHVPEADALPLG